jgi:hypothetical protein
MKTVAIFAGGSIYLLFMVFNLISLLSGAGFGFVPFLIVLFQILFVIPVFWWLRKSDQLGNYAMSLAVITALASLVMYSSIGARSLSDAPFDANNDAMHQLKIDRGALTELEIAKQYSDPHDKDGRKDKQKALKELKDGFSKGDKKGFDTTEAALEAEEKILRFDRDQRGKSLSAAPLYTVGAMMGLFIVFIGAPRKES